MLVSENLNKRKYIDAADCERIERARNRIVYLANCIFNQIVL